MSLFGPNINGMLKKGDLAGLTNALEHKASSTRQAAAGALGQLGDARALLPLMKAFVKESEERVRESIINAVLSLFGAQTLNTMVHALGDTDSRVQILAGKLLTQVNHNAIGQAYNIILDERAIAILISSLGHRDADVVNSSANILSAMGDYVVPKLITELQHDRENTGNIARILGRIKNPVAIKPLLYLLNSSTSSSQGAIEALATFGQQVIPPLRDMLRTGDERTRRNALPLLRKIESPEVIDLWAQFLEDKSNCRESVSALVNLGQPSLPILLAALEDKAKSWKRAAACEGLGNLGLPEAWPKLVIALEDEDNAVRAAAALSLGKLKQPEAIPALLLALADSNSTVVSNANRSLELLNERQLAGAINDLKLGKQDAMIILNDRRAVPVLFRLLEGKETRARDRALAAMNSLGETVFAQAFSEALAQKPETLIGLDDERAVQPLVKIITNDSFEHERKAAALTLGKWPGRGYDELVKLLDYEDIHVKQAVIFGLGQSGHESAFEYLKGSLGDKNETVVREAIKTISFLDDPAVTPTLIGLYEDRSQRSSIRCEAAIAMRRLGDADITDILEAISEVDDPNARSSLMLSILEFSPDDAWKIIQKEKDSRVSKTALSAFSDSQFAKLLIETNTENITEDMISAISPDMLRHMSAEYPDLLQKITIAILSSFDGEVWNRNAANNLIRLVPGTMLNAEVVNWMGEALWYELRTRGYKYEKGQLDKAAGTVAIRAISTLQNPAASNLLQIISRKKNLEVKLDDGCTPPQTVLLDFSDQKQLALEELGRRGNPIYDVANFIGSKLSETDFDKGRALIKEHRYQDLFKRATESNYRFRRLDDPMSAYQELVKDHPTTEVLQIIALDLAKRQRIDVSEASRYEKLLIQCGKSLSLEAALRAIKVLQMPWPQIYSNIERVLRQ